jgi:uncharacterized circularly permuted ATP-grasp superfamily protein
MSLPSPILRGGTDFAPYLPRFYDEALKADGAIRPGYEGIVGALAAADLGAVTAAVGRTTAALGVSFGEGRKRRPFQLDAVPRVVEASEWHGLAVGMRQRARALNAFIADVYGDRRIVAAGVMPARVIETAEGYEPELVGVVAPGGHAPVVGFDLVRGGDGRFSILEENLRTPSGLGYSRAARLIIDEAVPCAPPGERLDPAASYAALGEAIRAAAPDGGGDPSAAVLSDGPANSAWYEHRELARALDIPVVTPRSLRPRKGRLFADVETGRPKEVQVLYRRTDEDALRDARGEPTWIAELLLAHLRRGTLGVVNAPGAGVGDDKLIHAYVDDMVRFYLEQEPLIPAARSYDLSVPDAREEVLKRLDELVVKPRGGYGGVGVVIGRQATPDQLEYVAGVIRAQPEALIAQETVALSTHPTVIDGALEPRHVDLRAFAIQSEVVPAALTRAALQPDSMVVNSSREGGAKDTWVLAKGN